MRIGYTRDQCGGDKALQTDEVDGAGEEARRRFGPVISDSDAHVRQRRVVLERVVDVGRHVHDVLDVVTSQTVEVTRRGRVAEVQVGQHSHRERQPGASDAALRRLRRVIADCRTSSGSRTTVGAAQRRSARVEIGRGGGRR